MKPNQTQPEQVEQPINYSPEDEVKIRRYGRWRTGLLALCGVGIISFIGALYDNSCIKIPVPKIYETHQNAQQILGTMQVGKTLTDKLLNSSYQTTETEEVRKFYQGHPEAISRLDKAIKSVEIKIQSMESDSGFIQYQQDKRSKMKRFFGFYLGGLLAILVGAIGASSQHNKKLNLEKKYKIKK